MATSEQVNANRNNAKRSTGPKTPAGKAKVRYNALKHGLLAEAVLLPDEDAATFHDFSTKIRGDLRPVGEMESALVDRIVNILWRLRRFSDVETGLFVRKWAAHDEACLEDLYQLKKTRDAESLPKQTPVRRSELGELVDARMVEWGAATATEASEARSANPRQRLGDAFADDAATGNAFSKLARYETQLNRTLERTLNQLQELQQRRAAKAATR